jgi:hypothetical protein
MRPASLDLDPLGFYRYSEEFLLAASSIQHRHSFSPVPYYLYCRSLELALKAFLLTKGYTQQNLKRKFGHNLEKLLNRAKRHGLGNHLRINHIQEGAVRDANSYYQSKAFEYFTGYRAMTGYSGLPDLQILDAFVDELVNAIEPICTSHVRSS